jgi:hypothetical protein
MAIIDTSDRQLTIARALIGVIGLGHLIVGLMFWFAPHLAVEEILAWGPASGWTSILGSYDLSVAFALAMAFKDPIRNIGIVRFVGFLLVLHAATHMYYVFWDDAPTRMVFVSSYLVVAGLALWWVAARWLAPRSATPARFGQTPSRP